MSSENRTDWIPGFPQIIVNEIPWHFPDFSLTKPKFPWPKTAAFIKFCEKSTSNGETNTKFKQIYYVPVKCT